MNAVEKSVSWSKRNFHSNLGNSGLISLFSCGCVWLRWTQLQILRVTLSSLGLDVYRVEKLMCLVCMVLVGVWERLFFGNLISKSLCVFCRLLEARIKAAPWGMYKMCGHLSHVKCLWLCRAPLLCEMVDKEGIYNFLTLCVCPWLCSAE